MLAITTFITEKEILGLIILAGIVVWFVKAPPKFLRTTNLFLATPILIIATTATSQSDKLVQIAWFFTKAGAFVFGSGLAIVPFLYGGVVSEHQ